MAEHRAVFLVKRGPSACELLTVTPTRIRKAGRMGLGDSAIAGNLFCPARFALHQATPIGWDERQRIRMVAEAISEVINRVIGQ